MKRTIILLILTIGMAVCAKSQSSDTHDDLHVYLTGGVKFLQPKYFGHTSNISPAAVPTIGGGLFGK